MIVNDITFREVCPIHIPSHVFCNIKTLTIHLNASIPELIKILRSKGVSEKELQELEHAEHTSNEKHMESIITHETIHLLLAEKMGQKASVAWDNIDLKHNLSDFVVPNKRRRI